MKETPYLLDPAEEKIVRRLHKALAGVSSVALGPGIPALVRPLLSPEIQVYPLPQSPPPGPVDAAVLEPEEVSERGDLAGHFPFPLDPLQARLWIATLHHLGPEGESRIVRTCRAPVARSACVRLIITELGVLEVSQVGFELREVAPGVATDEVKKKTRASLHVADDIQLMEP